MRTRNKVSILAAAIIGLLLIPATAFAYTPGSGQFLTCVREPGPAVRCVAGPFRAGTPFSYEAAYNPTFATGSGTVNADGEAEFSFDASEVPAGSEITVTVEGTAPDGSPLVLSDVEATVDADGELAVTGSEAGLLAIGALGALALGGAALFASRRKRSTTSA